MTRPTVTSDSNRPVTPRTTAEPKSILRLHVKDTTWTSGPTIVASRLEAVEDRYWASVATDRLKNPNWINEADFWSKFEPAL